MLFRFRGPMRIIPFFQMSIRMLLRSGLLWPLLQQYMYPHLLLRDLKGYIFRGPVYEIQLRYHMDFQLFLCILEVFLYPL